MMSSLALFVPAFALGSLAADDVSISSRQQPTINTTVEYTTQCKTCPYNLCANVIVPWGGDPVTLTCWTEGDLVGDTDLWVETTDGCYLPEYDLAEAFDFREALEYCGDVPLEITRQDATVRYLSECKWEHSTSSESILYYGRDLDVELTCWAEGGDVVGNPYWYKTTDNCHVSGSGLWGTPDRDDLEWCGPDPGPRANETRRSLDDDFPSPRSSDTEERDLGPQDVSLQKRYLVAEQIGEEYAPCHTCPTATLNSTCRIARRYEYNDTVVSQCVKDEYINYPNGSIVSKDWMLTTDWCYVESWYFWVPPWDNYRFGRCEYWPGY